MCVCVCVTFQWLKFPLNGLWAQSRLSLVVGLLPLASGPACLGMAFPPFLMKQLNDDTDVKKVSRFKYATWNIRGLGEKEEE